MTALLGALDSGATSIEDDVDGHRVKLTSLDRVMWPQVGGTKRDLFRYYLAVAHRLLPHIAGRPLTLARYPEGVEGPNWFQTMCPHPPEWVTTHAIRARGGDTITRNYCVVHDLAGLLWAVNLGTIELHPLLSKASSFDEPAAVAFDLDPGPPASLVDACMIALRVRDLLHERRLRCFPKTSGGLGIHVMIPLGAGHTYRQTKTFAREVAAELARDDPKHVTSTSGRAERVGKVFVDWSQNDPNKSMISVYSMRALPWPAASAPVTWDEVGDVAWTGSLGGIPLHAERVVERARDADLFEACLRDGQRLI